MEQCITPHAESWGNLKMYQGMLGAKTLLSSSVSAAAMPVLHRITLAAIFLTGMHRSSMAVGLGLLLSTCSHRRLPPSLPQTLSMLVCRNNKAVQNAAAMLAPTTNTYSTVPHHGGLTRDLSMA
jgi:hypothetical protein